MKRLTFFNKKFVIVSFHNIMRKGVQVVGVTWLSRPSDLRRVRARSLLSSSETEMYVKICKIDAQWQKAGYSFLEISTFYQIYQPISSFQILLDPKYQMDNQTKSYHNTSSVLFIFTHLPAEMCKFTFRTFSFTGKTLKQRTSELPVSALKQCPRPVHAFLLHRYMTVFDGKITGMPVFPPPTSKIVEYF